MFRLRMNLPPGEETTEPKNANAKTGQHLFFFLFVSLDPTADFLSKEAMLCFQKVDKQDS